MKIDWVKILAWLISFAFCALVFIFIIWAIKAVVQTW